MRQCDIIRFLFNDLKESTSDLVLGPYAGLFEDELQDHYPFQAETEKWLVELYQSEKYEALTHTDRSLFFESAHPFLFLRDLALINNWKLGFQGHQRRDSMTGLLFSTTPEIALEATLALCNAKTVGQPMGNWFDSSQVMKNLEFQPDNREDVFAWRGCAYYFLYIFFTNPGTPPVQDELYVMLDPFYHSIQSGCYSSQQELREQCQIVMNALEPKSFETVMDRV